MKKSLSTYASLLIVTLSIAMVLVFIGRPLGTVSVRKSAKAKLENNINGQALNISGAKGTEFSIKIPDTIDAKNIVIGLFEKFGGRDYGAIEETYDRFVDDNPSFSDIEMPDATLVLKGPKIEHGLIRYWGVQTNGALVSAEIQESDNGNLAKQLTKNFAKNRTGLNLGVDFYKAAVLDTKIKTKKLFSTAVAEVSSLIKVPASIIEFDLEDESDGSKTLTGVLQEDIKTSQDIIIALGNEKNVRKVRKSKQKLVSSNRTWLVTYDVTIDQIVTGKPVVIETTLASTPSVPLDIDTLLAAVQATAQPVLNLSSAAAGTGKAKAYKGCQPDNKTWNTSWTCTLKWGFPDGGTEKEDCTELGADCTPPGTPRQAGRCGSNNTCTIGALTEGWVPCHDKYDCSKQAMQSKNVCYEGKCKAAKFMIIGPPAVERCENDSKCQSPSPSPSPATTVPGAPTSPSPKTTVPPSPAPSRAPTGAPPGTRTLPA